MQQSLVEVSGESFALANPCPEAQPSLGLNTIFINSVQKSPFYKKLVVNCCTLLTAINRIQ